jgi:cyanophycinase
MQKTKGILVLIGGAEKRKGKKRLLKRIAALNRNGTVALIPSASKFPNDAAAMYIDAFHDLGAKKVHVLDIRRRSEADRSRNLDRVAESGAIFFSGGDQVRLVEILGGTKLIAAIHDRYRQGALIAGTSAGAAAASDPMIFDGQDKGLVKGRVRNGPGFGFLSGITVDTHFVVRNRTPRLAQFLTSGLSRRGVGLAENTALFVHPNGVADVAGTGSVTLLSSDRLTYSNFNEIEDGAPISAHGLKLGFLSPGARFNLKKWSVVKT